MEYRVIKEYESLGCKVAIREPIMTEAERMQADDRILRQLEYALQEDKADN